MSNFKIENDALIKIIHHSLKHPAKHVMGLIIGTQEKVGDKQNIDITNVIPLFHSTPMTPSLTTAINMVP